MFGVPTTIAEPASLPYPTYYARSPAHLIQHSNYSPFHFPHSPPLPLPSQNLPSLLLK
jgi:hypothetical protein